jgi:hypothetical protein
MPLLHHHTLLVHRDALLRCAVLQSELKLLGSIAPRPGRAPATAIQPNIAMSRNIDSSVDASAAGKIAFSTRQTARAGNSGAYTTIDTTCSGAAKVGLTAAPVAGAGGTDSHAISCATGAAPVDGSTCTSTAACGLLKSNTAGSDSLPKSADKVAAAVAAYRRQQLGLDPLQSPECASFGSASVLEEKISLCDESAGPVPQFALASRLKGAIRTPTAPYRLHETPISYHGPGLVPDGQQRAPIG